MRQVVNKVYGCITANPNTRYESENIWACLFNQDENSRSGDNAENDLISDAQMKSFHAQITKVSIGWKDGLVDGWMGGWMGGWMEGWMDGWMGGWMD